MASNIPATSGTNTSSGNSSTKGAANAATMGVAGANGGLTAGQFDTANAEFQRAVKAAMAQKVAQGTALQGKPGDAFYIDDNGQAYVAQHDMFGRAQEPMPLEPGQLYMHPDGHVTIQGRTASGGFGNTVPTKTLTAQQWQEQLSRDETFMQGFMPVLKVLAPAILPGISNAIGGMLNGAPTSVIDPSKLGLDAMNTFDSGVMDQVLNNGVQGASQLAPNLMNVADPIQLGWEAMKTTGAETFADAAKQLGYDSFDKLVNEVNPSWLSDTAISQLVNPTTPGNPTTPPPSTPTPPPVDPTKAAGAAAGAAAAANGGANTNPLGKWLKDTFNLDVTDAGLSTLGTLLKTGIGLYGADKAADSAKELADKFDSYGAPYRQKLSDLYANPSSFLQSQEVQKPVQMASDIMARSLSTSGNPTGSGNAMQQLQSYSADQLFGKLGQEKDRLAGFGGLSAYNQAAPTAAANASNAQNSYLNVLGAGAADIFSPPKSYQSLYDLLNRKP